MSNLFSELKRRNVFRVAAAYVVAGWLLVEIFQVLIEIYAAPAWILKLFVAALVVGLPLVVAFSWAYEITPEGIKRESEVTREDSITHFTARRLEVITIVLLLGAMGMLAFDWSRTDRKPEPAIGPSAVQDAGVEPGLPAIPDSEKSIAVLPFENLSSDAENAGFAGGVHEDILTYLTKVEDLRVISRTSVLGYAGDQVDIRQVGRDLGVSHVLEGSVRRSGNRVRVTAQLIDARTDQHLWAENFDRELEDIFEIQSSVARDIVREIGAQLSPEESSRLSQSPTDSIAAYDLYLQARQILNRSTLASDDADAEAQRLLEEAVSIDPEFALAYALLARVHGSLYWFIDRTPKRLAAMKEVIDRAFELQPDLAEARVALAQYHYRGSNDYAAALEQLQAARAERPNDASILFDIGLTLRRLGRWRESVRAFSQSRRLDPGNPRPLIEEFVTVRDARFWPLGRELVRVVDRNFPDDRRLSAQIGLLLLEADGPTEAAQRYLAHPPLDDWYDAYARVELALMSRDPKAGLAAIERGHAILELVTLGMPEYYEGIFHAMAGDMESARDAWQAALVGTARTDQEKQNYGWPSLFTALAQARLGNADQARAACERATSILPKEKDQVHGLTFHVECLRVRAMLGERDPAISELETRVGQPQYPSQAWLRFHPEWDFLREDPRFRAIYES
ncbi:MAG: hypothetical protein R3200_08155 [Xanthomonadales bacterium]|nr:hypothetical protein [Xanthomonadales bacterium]